MKLIDMTTALLLGAALCTAPVFAQAPGTDTTKTQATGKVSKKAKEAMEAAPPAAPVAAKDARHKGGPTQNATTADIANAKAKGMVWVNTSTGVYHKDGEYFGATKQGKFMTEAEAQKGGYRGAKEPGLAAKNSKPAGAK
jgi:hypothetical protein